MPYQIHKWVVLDDVRAKCLALVDTELEGHLALRSMFPSCPPGDLSQTGFDVLPALVTVELLPLPPDSLRYQSQAQLFPAKGTPHANTPHPDDAVQVLPRANLA